MFKVRVFCFAALSLLAPLTLQADNDTLYDILTVEGEGKVKITASIADINLGIEVTDRSAKVAQSILAEKQSVLLAALRAAGVEKLETRHISLVARYDNTNINKIVGYSAETTVAFSSPVDRAGDLIDLGIESGANENRGITVRASDDELKQARLDALKKASARALEEGKHVMEALGLAFRDIKRVEVTPNYGGGQYYKTYALRSEGSEASASIEVSEQEVDVTASVKLILEYDNL